MNKAYEEVLKKAVESHDGLISPAIMINSFSGGSRSIPETLVAMEYLEMVPEEIHTGKVINFYRVTEKGFAVFYPLHKRFWFLIKGDLRTVVVAVIVSVLTTVITLLIQSKL